MAPSMRSTASTSNTAHHAQPSRARRGPPYSQEFVDAHPELCYAPVMKTIPLPEEDARRQPHVSFPTAYVPHRGGPLVGGALHLNLFPYGYPGSGQIPDASHRYNPPPPYPGNPVVNSAPVIPSTSRPTTAPVLVNGAPTHQTRAIPIPKPRHSLSPPTPDPSPTRPAPIHNHQKRTRAGAARHAAPPNT